MAGFNKQTTGKRLIEKIYMIIFLIVLGAGVSLRLYQYLMGRSLWEDEAHIALNFIKFGHLGLMSPLENFQTAPILFLWIVETFCDIFGSGEMSLRAFPLVVSIAALPFMYYMTRELTKSTLAALIAFVIFTFNITLIYFSSEIKSYTVDVSMYVFITYLLLSQNPFVAHRRTLLLAIAGSFAILCSNASAVVLVCAAIYLLVDNWLGEQSSGKKMPVIWLTIGNTRVLSIWLVVWLINYFRFIHNHPYGEGMKGIWSFTFSPRNVFRQPFADFIKARINDTIYTDMLFFTDKYYFPQILTFLVAFSVLICIVKKRWSILLFTVLPILLHLLVSMLKMYPFFFRFILYLLPPFIILISYGVAVLVSYLPKMLSNLIAIPIAVVFCYCCSYTSVAKFPSWDKEIGPVISFINQNYPDKEILVTTPYTLYTYYIERGIAKNKRLHPVKWQLTPAQYYVDDTVRSVSSGNYLLLYSVDGFADGYKEVLGNLDEHGYILRRFEYKTYGVAEVTPSE